MKIVPVQLGERSYKIFVGVFIKDLAPALKRWGSIGGNGPKKVLIVTQSVPKFQFGRILSQSLSKLGISSSFAVIPDGEENKNLKTVQNLYQQCIKEKLDRTSCCIALGGGVVGDIAGFVSATYLRGIPLVQVPTTLLAMVDSSIGGKTGVDLPEAKNFVGSFYQPKFVWIDLKTLKTLPKAEFQNGLAEVIKYGIIADKKLFKLLENQIPLLSDPTSPLLVNLIARCAKIKADLISKDEKETKGLREILNFGHTLGHAIESVTAYKSYKHGEAVSIGMCAAGFISIECGLWNTKEKDRMEKSLKLAGLPIRLKKALSPSEILKALVRDKKTLEGQLRFVLPVRIGKVIVKKISTDLALKGLEYVQS